MILHTSLSELKAQAQAQAQAQAMTRLTAVARELMDPALSNGLGSLQEDWHKGLRCPLKRCGTYHHDLGQHLRQSHHEIDVKAFRAVLELATSAPLLSKKTREEMRKKAKGRPASEMRLVRPTVAGIKKAARQRGADQSTMGARNLESRCDAQLGQRLHQLEEALGHTPTFSEAEQWWGYGLVSWIVRHYGTWNAFKGQHEVATNPRGGPESIPIERVVELLGAWHQVRGALPTYDETVVADRRLLPHPSTVLRAFCAERWETAMLRAAGLLRIHDDRYRPAAGLARRCVCGQRTNMDPCPHCGSPSLVVA